ncbi:MAG: hypothetical protein DHS80DRAFT_29220 [Piptocephalis tieghemiana]|nr:MAG: hypothetical protein DHS80DRAFT_29220 [Piptocephalis tieghemiana]
MSFTTPHPEKLDTPQSPQSIYPPWSGRHVRAQSSRSLAPASPHIQPSVTPPPQYASIQMAGGAGPSSSSPSHTPDPSVHPPYRRACAFAPFMFGLGFLFPLLWLFGAFGIGSRDATERWWARLCLGMSIVTVIFTILLLVVGFSSDSMEGT